MPIRTKTTTPTAQDAARALLDIAMQEPGVAEMIDLYEAAERAYTAANSVSMPREYTTSSANDGSVKRA